MLDALVQDLGLGDFESDLAMLDAPWLEGLDRTPPAKRRCLVGRRYDSATWLQSPSPEGPEGSPTKQWLDVDSELLRLSPTEPGWGQAQPVLGASEMTCPSPPQQMTPSPPSSYTEAPTAQDPSVEIPVTEASDVDCDLSSLAGPLYLIPALVSGRASLDASPSSLLVYVVSTSPDPFSGAPLPVPRPLAAPATTPRPQTAPRKRPRPFDSPRTYKCFVCQKLYDSRYKLKLHMSSHSALPPFDV